MSQFEVEDAIAASKDTVSRLQLEFDRIRGALSKEQERLNLLEKLRSLDDPAQSIDLEPAREVVFGSLEDAVADYLRKAGKPVHISRLRMQLLRDGVPIPGKGVDANVITRIRRDSRIERSPGRRGFYVLTNAKA